ncbi:response regulator [Tissierella carlieri]|jgi:two-component system response regulator YesN|uniref:response regulator transcription factor n=1 Tax=Tissierella TaxID=41273 RepID=UPI0028051564|nr:response regulator [uncultured Tissierella sp.]MDU5082544.1 response regulator [Bacillota bacterium]
MIKTLIVDDEILARDLLKLLISKNNIPLEVMGEAENGREAIELIFDLKPEVVFLDIEMPGSDGIDVMDYIKNHYIEPITFIVVTAFSYFEYAQSSLRLGAKDILLKPIEANSLKESIARVIGYKFTDNPLLNDILQYININYRNDIQLNQCAKDFHISVNQINRLFNRYFHMTFIKYLNKFRIDKAIELMYNEKLPIKEIATQVGFNNLNYFYKTFKIITGNTPKNYKQ